MARKSISTLDNARKSFLKGIKTAAKSAKKSQRIFAKGITTKAKQAAAARNAEYLLRWRILRNVGLVNAKVSPTVKNLNSRLKTKINKEFFDLQNAGVYSKGRVHRPLNKVSYVTPSGKTKEKYVLDENFKFLRTKKKTATQRGIFKTSKGYVVQKISPDSKVSVNSKGELVQKTGKMIFRTKGYRGKAIHKLINDIENGKFKLRYNQTLAMQIWGSTYVQRTFSYDNLDLFVEMMQEYESEMNDSTWRAFIDESDVTIIDNF